jgi:hypothetical protein
MKTMRIPCLAILLVLTLAAAVAAGSSSESGGSRDPVYVDSTDILSLESFPVQVRLIVRGSLPTPCHQAAWDVHQTDAGIDVTLWSTSEPGSMCVAVLEPVELSIPLGSFESADLPVTLNGESIGRVTVGDPSAGPAASSVPTLIGAGWSYGMCAGLCLADLVVSGHRLVLTGSGHGPEGVLLVREGALTPAGRERLDAAVAAVDVAALEPVYGCPDCADGGAAYLTFATDGVDTRHDMEAGRPPAELAELDAIATSIIDALVRCEPTDLVAVSEGCVPYER